MLAIRMQRTGRRGHAMFRVIVQESRLTPTSGRVVAQLGHYDPHTKTAVVDKDKASFYLGNGAQPSDRVARLLKKEGVKLPEWVEIADNKKKSVKHPEKLAKEAPAEAPAAEAAEPEAAESEVNDDATEKSSDVTTEEPAEAPEAKEEPKA